MESILVLTIPACKTDYETMEKFINFIANWLLVLTSPIWILPAFLWVLFRDEDTREKMLKGNGLIT